MERDELRIGARIRVTTEKYREYEIVYVSNRIIHLKDEDIISFAEPTDILNNYELVPCYELYLRPVELKMSDDKLCCCNSTDLFRYGCKCGGK